MRVPHGHQLVLAEEDEGVGARQLLAGGDESRDEGARGRHGDEVQDDLRVGGGVEDGPAVLQLAPQAVVVREVAVVRHGSGAEPVLRDKGLRGGEGGGGWRGEGGRQGKGGGQQAALRAHCIEWMQCSSKSPHLG